MLLTKEDIKKLDYDSLKELDLFIKKELEQKRKKYIEDTVKKLFIIYPQYDAIILAVKKCSSNNIKKSFNILSINKNLLYKAEQEISMNSLNKEFIDNNQKQGYDLFLKLSKFINLDDYEDCDKKNHEYAIFINKDLIIQQTFDYFS